MELWGKGGSHSLLIKIVCSLCIPLLIIKAILQKAHITIMLKSVLLLCEVTELYKSVNDLCSKFSHIDNHLILES